jgi:hypothetical protein
VASRSISSRDGRTSNTPPAANFRRMACCRPSKRQDSRGALRKTRRPPSNREQEVTHVGFSVEFQTGPHFHLKGYSDAAFLVGDCVSCRKPVRLLPRLQQHTHITLALRLISEWTCACGERGWGASWIVEFGLLPRTLMEEKGLLIVDVCCLILLAAGLIVGVAKVIRWILE